MARYTLKELERDLFKRNKKYLLMGVTIAIIHFVYVLFFYLIGFTPLIIYNLFAIALYLYYGVVCSQGQKYIQMYIYYAIEIPFHAILCTLLLGWSFRFMNILFCTVLVAFYLSLFIDEIHHHVIFPTVISSIFAVLYVVVKHITNNTDPLLKTNLDSKYSIFFTYFNIIFTFIGLIGFSLILTLEYNYFKNKLNSENKVLDNQASYDALTNLINRRSMDEHLKNIFIEYYREEEAFSVIMCDIDHFKGFNDTYGHDAGDYVLKEVSKVISDEVRDKDLVGRWGGEEFLIVLFTNKMSAAKLAERIRAQIEAHIFTYKNQTLRVTMTLGVSSYHAGSDVDSLIKSADKKLYRGKENGRNQVVF